MEEGVTFLHLTSLSLAVLRQASQLWGRKKLRLLRFLHLGRLWQYVPELPPPFAQAEAFSFFSG